MKKLLYAISLVLFLIILVSCNTDEKQVAIWGTEKIIMDSEPTIEKRKIVYEKTELKSDGINSYWFVVLQKKSGEKYNLWMRQEHSYFSIGEAKDQFDTDHSKIFLLSFTKCSEATFVAASQ